MDEKPPQRGAVAGGDCKRHVAVVCISKNDDSVIAVNE